MATADTKLNVKQKLVKARKMFLDRNIKKSGKNMQLEFKYFELADIVPHAIEIFEELGLVTIASFTGEHAVMSVSNADNMEEPAVEFVMPYRALEVIRNKEGRAVTNPLQALGSEITYMRRYLYMLVLDIVEQDDVDPHLTSDKAPMKPASTEERKEMKEKLVKEDKPTQTAVKKLKSLCKKLKDADGNMENFVQQIVVETNAFEDMSKEQCELLTDKITEILKAYEEDNA